MTTTKTRVSPRDTDRGWAWMVLVAACIQQVLNGVAFTTGLFQIIFLEEFGKDRQTTAWIGSVQFGMYCLTGPVSAALLERIGNLYTAGLGCLISAAGFFTCFFARNFLTVFMCYGVMVGLGNGICFMPWIVAVSQYFDKYRNLAFGIASAFIGIGTMVFAPLITYLEARYTWRGCMLIFSAVFLHFFPIGLVFAAKKARHTERDEICIEVTDDVEKPEQPKFLERHSVFTSSMLSLASLGSKRNLHILVRGTPQNSPKIGSKWSGTDSTSDGKTLKPPTHLDICNSQQPKSNIRSSFISDESADVVSIRNEMNVSLAVKSINDYNDIPPSNGVNNLNITCNHCKSMHEGTLNEDLLLNNATNPSTDVDVHQTTLKKITSVLCKDTCVILSFSSLCINGITFLVYTHFPIFCEYRGANSSDLSIIMTTIGACSIACRLLVGITSNSEDVDVLLLYTGACFLSSMFIIFLPMIGRTFGGQIAFTIGFGFYGNAYNSLLPAITVHICGLDDLTMAFSLQMFACGVGGLIAPPFGGWLYDVSGDYDLTFFTAGSFYMLVSLSLLAVPIVSRNRMKETELLQKRSSDCSA